MKRSIHFYTKILGMSIAFDTDYWTSLSFDNVTIGLHWNGGVSVPAIIHNSHGASHGATLTIQSDDIASDKQLLIDNNVVIVGEFDWEFGEIIVFKDPDGNILKLMNPKY